MDPTETKYWDMGMKIPQGRPRPKFIGESEEDRISGSGTVKDPKIVWLGKIPLDAETKKANEDAARRAASSLKTITHIYIRCAAQSTKFVDRDGKRISIWNPDSIRFWHRTTAADPHISLALGTNADNLVLHGYINVAVDENDNPTDFATSRNPDYVVDGDDRIFELFPYEADEQYCAPYCHIDHKVLVHACEFARAKECLFHDTKGLLDHFCFPRPGKIEIHDDHYCPCTHDLTGLMDHYCPCIHEKRGMKQPVECSEEHGHTSLGSWCTFLSFKL
ncbi:hypothetical protein F5Y06DRAFT_303764 [Hypoxylon sp. FL0890]|nr:hypothetical protein F5Y06DRAFT_303764 [Hypoxylon sp. FL0890]